LVGERLVDFSDAAATATNILTHRGLFELGFTAYLIEMAGQVATAVLCYQLLKPVNRTVALLALFPEVSGCVIKTFARCAARRVLTPHSIRCLRSKPPTICSSGCVTRRSNRRGNPIDSYPAAAGHPE
jgi:hypothetical protein